jgi:hypothetical protein
VSHADTFRSNLRRVGKSSHFICQLANGAVGCEFPAKDFEFVMHLFCDVMRHLSSLSLEGDYCTASEASLT